MQWHNTGGAAVLVPVVLVKVIEALKARVFKPVLYLTRQAI